MIEVTGQIPPDDRDFYTFIYSGVLLGSTPLEGKGSEKDVLGRERS